MNPMFAGIFGLCCGGLIGGGLTFLSMSNAEVEATTQSAAICVPSEQAIQSAIDAKPDYCSAVQPTLKTPTDAEATTAFQNRRNPMSMSKEPTNDIVKLGSCHKGTVTEIQCGADVDFGANGKFKQRMIGFSRTPSGWLAVLM